MITYRITSKSSNHKPTSSSDNSVRDKILSRASTKAAVVTPVGSQVQLIGTKRVGEVLAILTDPAQAHWKKEKPFFIKVKFFDNDQVIFTHSSSLRRKRK